MSEKLKVLVIGVGGNVSIGILKALRNSSLIDLKLYGACVNKNSAGFALSDQSMLCPLAFEPDFPIWLSKTVKKYNLDVVLSGVEEVNYVLSIIKDQQNVAKYLAPEYENVCTFNDKLKTIHWLKKNNIDHPATLDLDCSNDLECIGSFVKFPMIVKPKIGKGSKGFKIISDKEDLNEYIDKGGFIAQELIGTPESEYTCGVYKSKFGYTQVIVMRRVLANGSTSQAEVVKNNDIERYCHQIATALNTTCPFNIQLRLSSENKPICFEINMRLSGTAYIRHHFGFKDCEAWINEEVLEQNSKDLFDIQPGVAIRYEEEVFFKQSSLDQLRFDECVNIRKEFV